MKRGIYSIAIFLSVLVVILSLTIVYAQNLSNQSNQSNQDFRKNLGQAKAQITEKSSDILEMNVSIPNYLETPAKIIFGIEQGISLQRLIIVLGVWIGFLIFLLEIMKLMPFLNKGVSRFLGAIIITCLVSITGALDSVARFFFDIAGFFKWSEQFGWLQVVVAILLAAIIVLSFSWVVKKLVNRAKIEEAEMTGTRLGARS